MQSSRLIGSSPLPILFMEGVPAVPDHRVTGGSEFHGTHPLTPAMGLLSVHARSSRYPPVSPPSAGTFSWLSPAPVMATQRVGISDSDWRRQDVVSV